MGGAGGYPPARHDALVEAIPEYSATIVSVSTAAHLV
jgi:hypothetical protein